MVQRPLHLAIVDEVDSILIDEARTPLIISGPGAQSTSLYQVMADVAAKLKEGEDYTVDEKQKTVAPTETGIAKTENSSAFPICMTGKMASTIPISSWQP